MNERQVPRQIGIPSWLVLLVAIAAIAVATAALTATLVVRPSFNVPLGGMMGDGAGAYRPGGGMMGGAYGPGAGSGVANGLQPGDPGFVAGTAASPRVVSIIAGPGYTFSPDSIRVARGETITFQITTMGPLVHEFMVGPADAVATDTEGTPEIADISMMQTKSLTYAFVGSGPYAFACHAEGHYEAGMRGTITVVD